MAEGNSDQPTFAAYKRTNETLLISSGRNCTVLATTQRDKCDSPVPIPKWDITKMQ